MLKHVTWPRKLAAIGVFVITLSAYRCSKPQEAYLTVQLCLQNQNGVEHFLKIMHDTASTEGLKFVDRSAVTEQELNDIRSDKLVKLNRVPTINVGIEGEKGLGVTAGNLGLPSNQVALGFTAGSNAAKAHKLSDRLVGALSQLWRVETVPKGQGVFPMKDCDGNPPA